MLELFRKQLREALDCGLSEGDLQHNFNALHVFCRLRDMGLTQGEASSLAQAWEYEVKGTIYST